MSFWSCYLGCVMPHPFLALMNSIFHEKLDEFVIIYICDILVYSKSIKEHIGKMRKRSLKYACRMILPMKKEKKKKLCGHYMPFNA